MCRSRCSLCHPGWGTHVSYCNVAFARSAIVFSYNSYRHGSQMLITSSLRPGIEWKAGRCLHTSQNFICTSRVETCGRGDVVGLPTRSVLPGLHSGLRRSSVFLKLPNADAHNDHEGDEQAPSQSADHLSLLTTSLGGSGGAYLDETLSASCCICSFFPSFFGLSNASSPTGEASSP